jgi:epoxyqueuosine reductase
MLRLLTDSPQTLAYGTLLTMHTASDTAWITERAKSLAFDLCGVAPAEKFPELAQSQAWLAKGYAGEMTYLSDPRRSDPQKAFPGIRSVIVCALNYNAPQPKSIAAAGDANMGTGEPRGWISRYAWGTDYHEVLRSKLAILMAALRERFDEPFEARACADTGPLQERVFAKHAGLGWIGKNTLLLNQAVGSWFFLGTILTTLDLNPSLASADSPPPDLCGSCTRCIDACPTGAFIEPYVMDARRCISYLTIELRGSIPEDLREPIGGHVFGCDICQDVCPWNRRAPLSGDAELAVRTELVNPALGWLAELDAQSFRRWFRQSPVQRAKLSGLLRNVAIAMGNSGLASYQPKLQQWADGPDPVLAEAARWASARLSTTETDAATHP